MNKLYVVGIGPGAAEEITPRAMRALEDAQVIAGYGVYVELVRPLFPEKEYLTTAMRKESERCRMAIEAACSGKRVAMISSGDAGVYGMAGLILEMAQGKGVDVEVIPGVTAALSGGAVLGAPLTHDFAVVSLSDLLTPWEKIEKRLALAAEADFCIAIYNPSSVRRADHLRRACEDYAREQGARHGLRGRAQHRPRGRGDGADDARRAQGLCGGHVHHGFRRKRADPRDRRRMVTPRGYRDV